MVDDIGAAGASPGPTSPAPASDPGIAALTLVTGAWRQAVVAVAGRLDLGAMLGARAADLEEVCYSLGTPRQATQLFLAAGEAIGLVVEQDGEYRLGPLGHALRPAAAGAVLAEWAASGAERRVFDALWATLREPSAGAPGAGTAPGAAPIAALGLPYGPTPPPDAPRARAVLQALHGAGARALAATLLPPPAGAVIERGGQGLYARALLERHGHLAVVLADAAPWAVDAADANVASLAARARSAEAPAAERATFAVVAPLTRTLSLGALRTQLAEVVAALADDARVAVVGRFRGGAGRPLAPLLALLELAAGGPGWCPTAAQVADAVQGVGFHVERSLLLPEPDAAVIARRP